MDARGPFTDESEPFFIFKDRSPVRPHHCRKVLRILLSRIGLNGQLYDVHSLRSGRTGDLAKFGYSIDQIKAMGRQRSNAVYRYLKQKVGTMELINGHHILSRQNNKNNEKLRSWNHT